jgi:hypothetical protein
MPDRDQEARQSGSGNPGLEPELRFGRTLEEQLSAVSFLPSAFSLQLNRSVLVEIAALSADDYQEH